MMLESYYQIAFYMVDDHSDSCTQWLGEGLRHAVTAGQIRLAVEWHYFVRPDYGTGMAVYSPAWVKQAQVACSHGFGVGLAGGCI